MWDEPPLNQYAKWMGSRYTFGDNFELSVAATVLRRTICVTIGGSGHQVVAPGTLPGADPVAARPGYLYLYLWNYDDNAGSHFTPYIKK
jgi:hypothetical protein